MLVEAPARIIRSTARAHRPKRYFALLASVLALAALGPLVEHWFWARVAVSSAITLSLLMAALTAEGGGKSRPIALVLAGFTAAMWLLVYGDFYPAFSTLPYQMITCGGALLFFGITSSIMLKDVYSGDVTHNRICGAVCVYFLMGVCFAMIHMMIYLADSHAYKDSSASDSAHMLSENLASHDRFPIFIYFSYCTLSTVGYGDITPVSRLARTFAWIEGVSGQIYLTVLVARLVGLHIASVTKAKEDEV
jgi:hypothetical protein